MKSSIKITDGTFKNIGRFYEGPAVDVEASGSTFENIQGFINVDGNHPEVLDENVLNALAEEIAARMKHMNEAQDEAIAKTLENPSWQHRLQQNGFDIAQVAIGVAQLVQGFLPK